MHIPHIRNKRIVQLQRVLLYMKPDIYKLKIYTLPLFIFVSTGFLFFAFRLPVYLNLSTAHTMYMVLVKSIG